LFFDTCRSNHVTSHPRTS